MILRDRVDVLAGDDTVKLEDVPAHVGYRSIVAGDRDDPFRTAEKLTCILRPDVDVLASMTGDRIRWRGTVYGIEGPPLIRRKAGRDHHQTLTLYRLT